MKRSAYAMPYVFWMALFIVVPLVIVVYYGLTVNEGGTVSLSLSNLARAFDPLYVGVFIRSVGMAAAATAICLLIGYPLALTLASRDFKRGATLLLLIVIPMWMNFLLRTYAWINLLNDTGIVAQALRFLGVENVTLLYNTSAVVVGLVYNFLPFMVLPIYSVLIKIEPNLYEAAEDLGANSLTVFARVTLPLSLPGIISGITMCFMPAITTFAVSRLLGGGMVPMYGELIENQFYFMRDWHFGATLSLVMMALVLLSSLIMRKYDSQGQGGMLW
jgi:spermidine/putrescine transport system permease protein